MENPVIGRRPPAASDHHSGSLRLRTLGGLTLTRPGGTALTGLRPRKLALLAYLACAGRPCTRDHPAELFWGDRDDVRARHSLRDALSTLRGVLGPDALTRGVDAVALTTRAPLDVDVLAFHAAARAERYAEAVALYGGPFLDGLHVGESPGFGEWSLRERVRAERRFVLACAPEYRRLAAAGQPKARAGACARARSRACPRASARACAGRRA